MLWQTWCESLNVRCTYQMVFSLLVLYYFEEFLGSWKRFCLFFPIKVVRFPPPSHPPANQENLEIVYKSSRKAVRSRIQDSVIPLDPPHILLYKYSETSVLFPWIILLNWRKQYLTAISKNWLILHNLADKKIRFSSEDHKKSLVQSVLAV